MDNHSYLLLVEFRVTPKDLRQQATDLRSRSWTYFCHPSRILLVFLSYALWKSVRQGIDWNTLFIALLVVFIGLSQRLIWHIVASLCPISKVLYRIRINENEIVTETLSDDDNQTKIETVNWEIFTDAGSAEEMKHWFMINSDSSRHAPRHGVWIPKTAFESEADLNNFRTFLKEKMGELFKSLHE